MMRDNRHDSAYIFGAICPARAVGAAGQSGEGVRDKRLKC
jgi:hypothetical protein